MKLLWLVSITLLMLADHVYNQSNVLKTNQRQNGVSDGHRLITRALWRIFDALMEKKNHEALYGRVKIVEGAVSNIMTLDARMDSELKGIKDSLDTFKDEIVVMKKELETIKEMESRIRSLEEWQLRVGGQNDVSPIGEWAEGHTSCPAPFDQVGAECMHVVINNNRKWEDARTECAFLGGDLASPVDMDNFRNYLRNLPSEKRPTYAWIGGFRTEDDIWMWVSGNKQGRLIDMSDKIWNVDLPNGIGDCVGLFELSGYRAYDYKCEEEDNFICQYFFE